MRLKKMHTSIRINESEGAFLDSIGISVLRAARIGIMTLKNAAQTDSPHPCIYLGKTGETQAPPAGPCDKGETPPRTAAPAVRFEMRWGNGHLPH